MIKTETAVILAAGLGSRLKDKTTFMPKGFLEIDGLSLIERSVKNLLNAGIKKIIIGTGHQSEYYEKLAEKIPQIICCKSPIYATSGSMYTLYNSRNLIDSSFLLLESDLLYDAAGLQVLIDNSEPNIILASGQTHSNDEVFIETDKQGYLVNMSKKPETLQSINAELVGITKISYQAFLAMCQFAEEQFKTNLKIDYEYILVGISKTNPIFVNKIEDYVWCEIDDENHLQRAMNLIYPKIQKSTIK